jgi:hypothetical protein
MIGDMAVEEKWKKNENEREKQDGRKQKRTGCVVLKPNIMSSNLSAKQFTEKHEKWTAPSMTRTSGPSNRAL